MRIIIKKTRVGILLLVCLSCVVLFHVYCVLIATSITNAVSQMTSSEGKPSTVRSYIKRYKHIDSMRRKYFQTHFEKLLQRVDNVSQVLIYQCDTQCQKNDQYDFGLTSSFLISLLAKRKFLIYSKSQCSTFGLYETHNFDLRLSDMTKFQGHTVEYVIHDENTVGKARRQSEVSAFRRKLELMDMKRDFKTDVLLYSGHDNFIDGARRHVEAFELFPWLHTLQTSDILSIVHAGLFQTQSHIRSLVDSRIVTEVGEDSLVCFHGDVIKDVTGQKILDYLNTMYRDGYKFIFTGYGRSNSKWHSSVRKYFGKQIITTDFNDKMPVTSCPDERQRIIDMHVLKLCDVLIVTDGIRAAYTGDNSRELYCCDGDGVIFPCSRNLVLQSFKYAGNQQILQPMRAF